MLANELLFHEREYKNYMKNIVLKNLLIRHPNMIDQIEKEGRCWLSVSRTKVEEVIGALNEHFEKEFNVIEIEPDFEHVFFDVSIEENNYENLLKISHLRSEWNKANNE